MNKGISCPFAGLKQPLLAQGWQGNTPFGGSHKLGTLWAEESSNPFRQSTKKKKKLLAKVDIKRKTPLNLFKNYLY